MTLNLDAQLQSLVQRAEQSERKARQRALIYSLIPIVVAGLLIWFTGRQIQSANEQLSTINAQLQSSQQDLGVVNGQLAQARQQIDNSRQQLTAANEKLKQAEQDVAARQADADRYRALADQLRGQVDELQKRVNELNKSLDKVTADLRLATDFNKAAYQGDVYDFKGFLMGGPQDDVFLDLIDMLRSNVGWKLGGTTPQEGFDSPGLAAFLLNKHTGTNFPPAPAQSDLRNALPVEAKPKPGDIVFYKYGYTMFYFEDHAKTPFVLGMTPVGIIALKPDFETVLSYGAVQYLH